MKITGFVFLIFFFYAAHAQSFGTGQVHIQYTPGHPSNRFIPAAIIGAAFDGHEKGDMDRMLNEESITAMHAVGLKPLSYRLRTELAGEVWHWNPTGKWSETGRQQGYWISDSQSAQPIMVSNGYRLPRRGNTIDQANDDGYSRLDDGSLNTFWKSNPYLDEYFTHESNTIHPQWAIIDLGTLRNVNAIKIAWGNPFATSFTVDYALDIGSDYFEPFQPQLWHPFPINEFENAKGRTNIITVSKNLIKVRFVRISMSQSTYTGAMVSTDKRDRIGFAISEIGVGRIDEKGKFHDWVHHAPDHKTQSRAYVSSADPWHRATDIDPDTEQAGIDRFFAGGLTNHQPVMMPSGLLYDTPENMEALVTYLKAKNYPVNEMEMGEEPEGQLISPVDYGALYYQWGKKIKQLAPYMRLGGPGFATLAFTEDDTYSFTEAKWTRVFLDYLKKHNALNLFDFFSFEWYPFDDMCEPTAPQLALAPQMLEIALKNMNNNILPPGTPIYIGEYAYSAYGGRAEVEIEGALMYADILGKFLTLGGSKSYLYGYEPAYLEQTDKCDYGNNILFGLDNNGKIAYRTAAFYGMQMMIHDWAQPADSLVEIYPVTSTVFNGSKLPLITAYAIHKQGGQWSVALINKDPKRTWDIRTDVVNTVSGKAVSFYSTQMVQYSRQQYHWVNKASEGHPSLSLPPVRKMAGTSSIISLPPYSLTIIW